MVFNRNKLNEYKRQGEYLILQKEKPLIISGFQIHSWSWRNLNLTLQMYTYQRVAIG